jgi:hypothetical protein
MVTNAQLCQVKRRMAYVTLEITGTSDSTYQVVLVESEGCHDSGSAPGLHIHRLSTSTSLD